MSELPKECPVCGERGHFVQPPGVFTQFDCGKMVAGTHMRRLAERMKCRNAESVVAALRARVAELEVCNKRCETCNSELSYCGEMTVDGPSLDCEVCQLRDIIKDLRARVVGMEEACREVIVDYDNACRPANFCDELKWADFGGVDPLRAALKGTHDPR